jgi:hypothetical protein
MDEVTLVASEAGRDLRARPDQEIVAFNVAATGYRDARLLSIAARGDDGDLYAGLSGGPGADAATSNCCGSAATSAGTAWGPGS